MDKWEEFAKEKLGTGDQIMGTWPAHYNGKGGHIVLSKKRLLFVTEKGTFHKTVELLLDKGYDQFNGNETKNNGQMVLTDIKGAKYSIETPFLSNIQNVFDEQRKNKA